MSRLVNCCLDGTAITAEAEYCINSVNNKKNLAYVYITMEAKLIYLSVE